MVELQIPTLPRTLEFKTDLNRGEMLVQFPGLCNETEPLPEQKSDKEEMEF